MVYMCFSLLADMSTVICENDDKCKSLLNDAPSCVRQLVHIKPVSKETLELAQRKNIRLYSFEEVERIGAEKKNKPVVSLLALFFYYFIGANEVLFSTASTTLGFMHHLLYVWNDGQS